MTEAQWDVIENDVLGLWGSGTEAFNQRRMAAWKRRWLLEPFRVVSEAIRSIERQPQRRAGWPSPGEMHAAISVAKRERAANDPVNLTEPDRPLTARELSQIAAELEIKSYRRTMPMWKNYLHELAGFYAESAEQVRKGSPALWPPPTISGVFGEVLAGFAAGRVPPKRAVRDSYEQDRSA